MRDQKALNLFQQILRTTEDGKLSWQPTAEPDSYVTTLLGKLTVQVRPYTSTQPWGEPLGPPSMLVKDDNNNLLLEVNNSIEGIQDDDLKALLVFARRSALDADKKIDELLGELRKLDEDIPF